MEAFFALAQREHDLAQERRKEQSKLEKLSVQEVFQEAISSHPELLEAALDKYYASQGLPPLQRRKLEDLQLEAETARFERERFHIALAQLLDQGAITRDQLAALTDRQGKPLGLDVQPASVRSERRSSSGSIHRQTRELSERRSPESSGSSQGRRSRELSERRSPVPVQSSAIKGKRSRELSERRSPVPEPRRELVQPARKSPAPPAKEPILKQKEVKRRIVPTLVNLQ